MVKGIVQHGMDSSAIYSIAKAIDLTERNENLWTVVKSVARFTENRAHQDHPLINVSGLLIEIGFWMARPRLC